MSRGERREQAILQILRNAGAIVLHQQGDLAVVALGAQGQAAAAAARLDRFQRVGGDVLHRGPHGVGVAAHRQTARAVDLERRSGRLQGRAEPLPQLFERSGEIHSLLGSALGMLARPGQLGEPLGGPAYVLADPVEEILAQHRVGLVARLFHQQLQVVQRVLQIVGDGRGHHPDRLPPLGAGQPLGEHFGGRPLGLVQAARALGVEQGAGEEHACERRREPVDEDHHPLERPVHELRLGDDVVEARQQQADEKARHDDEDRSQLPEHERRLTEEMSYLLGLWTPLWNRTPCL